MEDLNILYDYEIKLKRDSKYKYNLNSITYRQFTNNDPLYKYNYKIYIYSYEEIKLLMLMDIINRNKLIYLLENEDIIILMDNLNKYNKKILINFFYNRINVNETYFKYYIYYFYKLKQLNIDYNYDINNYINNKKYYSLRLISDILYIDNSLFVNQYFKNNEEFYNIISNYNKNEIKKIVNNISMNTNYNKEDYLNNDIMINIILILSINKNNNVYYWLKYTKLLLSKRLILFLYYQFKNNIKINKILYYLNNLDNNYKLIKYFEYNI